jgi:hypothetical protein
VLKPGGIFVASTFLTPFAPLGEIVGDSTIRPISQVRLQQLLWASSVSSVQHVNLFGQRSSPSAGALCPAQACSNTVVDSGVLGHPVGGAVLLCCAPLCAVRPRLAAAGTGFGRSRS